MADEAGIEITPVMKLICALRLRQREFEHGKMQGLVQGLPRTH